jgi:hypothetical protein
VYRDGLSISNSVDGRVVQRCAYPRRQYRRAAAADLIGYSFGLGIVLLLILVAINHLFPVKL